MFLAVACCLPVSFIVVGGGSYLAAGMTVPLSVFVCTFHLVLCAFTVFKAVSMHFDLDSCGLICVISSAYSMLLGVPGWQSSGFKEMAIEPFPVELHIRGGQ